MAPHPSSAVRRFHPHVRDLWTANVRRATSWVAVASVGLTAALVGLAAKETPARHTTGTGTSTGGTASTGGTGASTGTGTPAGGSSGAATPSAGAGATRSTTATSPSASTSGSIVQPSTGSPQVSTGLS